MANRNTKQKNRIFAQERKQGNTQVVLKVPMANYHSTHQNAAASMRPVTFNISIVNREGVISQNLVRNTQEIVAGNMTRHIPINRDKPSFFQPVRRKQE